MATEAPASSADSAAFAAALPAPITRTSTLPSSAGVMHRLPNYAAKSGMPLDIAPRRGMLVPHRGALTRGLRLNPRTCSGSCQRRELSCISSSSARASWARARRFIWRAQVRRSPSSIRRMMGVPRLPARASSVPGCPAPTIRHSIGCMPRARATTANWFPRWENLVKSISAIGVSVRWWCRTMWPNSPHSTTCCASGATRHAEMGATSVVSPREATATVPAAACRFRRVACGGRRPRRWTPYGGRVCCTPRSVLVPPFAMDMRN